MNEYKKFNFTNLCYAFKGKNGRVILNKDNQVYIKREGWFGIPYQLFTGGPVLFNIDEIEGIDLKEPDWMRGYIDFHIKGKKKVARVWLTRPAYVPYAKHMKDLIEDKQRIKRFNETIK